MITPRYTRDGSDALERHLAGTCEQVRAGVQALVPAATLEAVLLGGGYGRGEGGVRRTPDGDQPYNDLEFYVCVRGWAPWMERRFRGPLHELGERLTPAAGLEVEFKVLTLGKLRSSTASMFYYDLVMGHRWLLGDEALLAGCDHHRDAGRIPLHEATRLLMNRCSGLLFSLERLQRPGFDEADADFVGRNLAKARLAFGDVLLTAHGQYHWSCQERHQRLQRFDAAGLPFDLAQLRQHHADGVGFKLHPVRTTDSRDTLATRHAELSALGRQLWLWLESRRLGVPFTTPGDYAGTPANLCPETGALRNRLVNLRTFGAGQALGSLGGRYPRERLLRALALLLWSGDGTSTPGKGWTPGELRVLQLELDSAGETLATLLPSYQRLWGRFN